MNDYGLPHDPDWDHPTLERYQIAGLLRRSMSLPDTLNRARGRLCYLATPYSREVVTAAGTWDPVLSLQSVIAAARWAAMFAAQGVTAISPVVQSGEMLHCDAASGTPGRLDALDGQFWEAWCWPFLMASDLVIVPPMTGWQASAGLWTEVRTSLMTSRQVIVLAETEGPGQ